ncbi:hypothetical protein [Arthrobacter sp. ISL-28]|uniref:hypothetical protein n=1 Tax=Arthrobacter sp. ISL-28 TaxID=2819108 RepID=UPI001BE56101|nr:hypothetical protein [Arthrobacter sp. ISL-28]MBT2523275.1 hypothetical protein [Arthrobacter sp. ISL-28]
MTNKSPQPNSTTAAQTQRKSVFVVSPIGAPGTEVHRRANYALKYIFREALTADEWDVHRADEGKSPDSIGQHVIKKLYEADLVIADLTGHNPNVFYELAIAHGWRKPVVHLIAKGENVPFDIVDQRTIFYDITDLASVEDAVALLREYAEYALMHADELVTPLTSFELFNQIRADDAEGGVAVAEVLEQVVSRLSRLEGRLSGSSDVTLHGYTTHNYRSEDTLTEAQVSAYADKYWTLKERVENLAALDNRNKQETLEMQKLEREMESILRGLPVVDHIVTVLGRSPRNAGLSQPQESAKRR